MATIRLISLGCSKNTVDSEVITGNLQQAGHEILDDHSARNPQVIIVNTCGFIGDAKEESIQYILQSEHLKKKHRIEKVVVMGCLVQRHLEELVAEFPDVDAWFGVHEKDELLKFLSEDFEQTNLHTRLLSTPAHYA